MDSIPSSVVCFKNGFSFVTVPVALPTVEDKSLVQEFCLGPLPEFAVHGTVRVKPESPDSTMKIFSVAKSDSSNTAKDLKMPGGSDFSFPAFMEANVGARVELNIKTNEEVKFSRSGSGVNRLEGLIKWVQPSSATVQKRMAIIQTGTNRDELRDELIDCSMVCHIKRVEDIQGERRLGVRYNEGGSCFLSYLTKGLTWAPAYTIILDKDSQSLNFEGQAYLICNLSGFNGTPIKEMNLVAGQPKIKYQHICDPLVSGANAEEFISLFEENSGHSRGPMPNRRRMGGPPPPGSAYREMEGFDSITTLDEAEGIEEGKAVQDFFLYKLKNVPLRKEHPLTMPFVADSKNISFEDIYCVDLNKRNTETTSDEDQNSLVEVLHSIRFTNPHKEQPLTTGPISILSKESQEIGGDQFLVQGELKFTGPDQKVTVDITKSLDVQARIYEDTEKERKTELVTEGAKLGTFDSGKRYAEVIEKTGRVIIKNNKECDIKCKVEHNLFGHIISSTPDPKESNEKRTGNMFNSNLNPTTRLVWEISVPGKGQAEIRFKYCIKELIKDQNKKGGFFG